MRSRLKLSKRGIKYRPRGKTRGCIGGGYYLWWHVLTYLIKIVLMYPYVRSNLALCPRELMKATGYIIPYIPIWALIRTVYSFHEYFWLISVFSSKVGWYWNNWLSVFPSLGGQYFTVLSQGLYFTVYSLRLILDVLCSGKYSCPKGQYYKSLIPI